MNTNKSRIFSVICVRIQRSHLASYFVYCTILRCPLYCTPIAVSTLLSSRPAATTFTRHCNQLTSPARICSQLSSSGV